MTHFDPDRHHRRSVRLPGYDYTKEGAYFVTVCVWDRSCLLGEVVDESVRLNDAGRLVHQEWFRAAAIRDNLVLEPSDFVVMPNHIHGIIHLVKGTVDIPRRGEAVPRPGHIIPHPTRRGEASPRPDRPDATPRPENASTQEGEATPRPYDGHGGRSRRGAAAGSVGAIIGQFKSVTTKAINAARNTPGARLWQRGYYEHVVRDEADLERIRRYIVENPARWAKDPERPGSPTHENLIPSRRGEAVPRPERPQEKGEAAPRPYGDHREHGGHGERGGPRR